MTTTIIATSITSSFNLKDAGDTLTLLAGVSITNSANSLAGLYAFGTDNAVSTFVDGSIVASSGVSLVGTTVNGDHTSNGFNYLNVGSTGSVRALVGSAAFLNGKFGSVFNYGDMHGKNEGVTVWGDNAVVHNEGVISGGQEAGVYLLGQETTGAMLVTNQGSITGYKWGVLVSDAVLLLVNSGTISAAAGVAGVDAGNSQSTSITNTGTIIGPKSISLGSAADKVTNSGNLIGKVDLAGGNDVIFNSGTISSDIDSGAGHDLFENNGGELVGSFTAGAGDDEVINSGIINGEVRLDAGANKINNIGGTINDNVFSGSGNDSIVNSGIIKGKLDTGGGDDFVDNTSGTIIGQVNMGAGNDLYFGNGATTNFGVAGGLGSDFYVVDNSNADLRENEDEGIDSVHSSANFKLQLHFENLTLTGGGNIRGVGNDANNSLTGNIGDNRLLGRGGNDFIYGEEGDDRMHGGTGADTLYGGESQDILRGGKQNDRLSGDDGADVLRGNLGNDKLLGGDGDDTLYGGAGKDILAGGADADNFVFQNIADSRNDASADKIKDFQLGIDKIDLSGIATSPDPFSPSLQFRDSGPFDGFLGEFRLETKSNTVEVLIDLNGDMTADMKIIVSGNLALTLNDFII